MELFVLVNGVGDIFRDGEEGFVMGVGNEDTMYRRVRGSEVI